MLGFRPFQLDGEQSVFEVSFSDFHPVSQHKGSLELAGSDAAVEVSPSIFIFLAPPSMDELLRRRQERGTEDREVMAARQRLAEVEMSFADRYDYVVVNDDAERAAGEVEEILERCRSSR